MPAKALNNKKSDAPGNTTTVDHHEQKESGMATELDNSSNERIDIIVTNSRD